MNNKSKRGLKDLREDKRAEKNNNNIENTIIDINSLNLEQTVIDNIKSVSDEHYFKNILWIDDRDDKDNQTSSEWMKGCLKNPDEHLYIKQVEFFKDAVDEIFNFDYDLVIFDIDLNKGFDIIEEEKFRSIEEIFENYNIRIDKERLIRKENNDAGIHLYLLLLAKGYPLNRMIIYSANGKVSFMSSELYKSGYFVFGLEPEDENSKDRKYSNIEKTNEKDKRKLFIYKTEKLDLSDYYQGNDVYYKVRRLVYQACDYWNVNIPQINSDISFNKLYFSKNADLMVERATFVSMFDRIKMLFPVIKPSNTEDIYYQAMQIAASFSEENAILNNINGSIRRFHQIIRNFRNWSAHNKFENHGMNPDQFAFLFCILLRTYFEEPVEIESDKNNNKENKKTYHLKNTLYYYEEVYFDEKLNCSLNWNDVNTELYKTWEYMYNEVKFDKGRKGVEDIISSLDSSSILFKLGQQDFSMPLYYLAISLFDTVVKKHNYIIDNIETLKTQLQECIDSNISTFYITKTYKYSFERNTIASKAINDNDKGELLFEKIAYYLIKNGNANKS